MDDSVEWGEGGGEGTAIAAIFSSFFRALLLVLHGTTVDLEGSRPAYPPSLCTTPPKSGLLARYYC